jgi:hypothetical protein
MPAKAKMKKFRERPNLAGRRIKKYRASSQLCGPANRKTVTIDTCSGSQLANAAETKALPMTMAANDRTDTRGVWRERASGHKAIEMLSTRSMLERTREHRPRPVATLSLPDSIPRLGSLTFSAE